MGATENNPKAIQSSPEAQIPLWNEFLELTLGVGSRRGAHQLAQATDALVDIFN